MQFVELTTEGRLCIPENNFLGYEEENDANKLVFRFTDGFIDGFAEIILIRNGEKGTIELEKVDETYEFPVKRSILTQEGNLKFQLVITKSNGFCIKYNPFTMIVLEALDSDIPMPEEYPSWTVLANTKLAELEEAVENSEKVLNDLIEAKESGEFKGEKGDKGDKGDPGAVKIIVVNEFPTEDIDESAIYMKRVAEAKEQNKYEEYIYVDGEWESLGLATIDIDLSDYVKNTDYATATKGGVCLSSSSFGASVASNGFLAISCATEAEIDGKSNVYRPIVPKNLDYAVKKAIVDSKLILTDEEKQKARNFIGVTEEPKVQIITTQLQTNSLYRGIIDSNTTFVLPKVTDNTKLNTIQIQAVIDNYENISIDLGTTKYFGDIPELGNGSFILYYEYDGANWCVGALPVVSEV